MGKLKKLLLIFGILLVPAVSFADTHTAASCKRDDVNSVIQDASFVTGDILSIPTCSGTDGTWDTAGITIPDSKKVTIQGDGDTKTVITHSGSFTAVELGVSGSRVTGIGFMLNGTGMSVRVSGSGWRLDHNRFYNITGLQRSCVNPNSYNVSVLPTGLIDNNDFSQCRIAVDGFMTFLKQGGAWDDDTVLGSENAVYIEDNTFYRTIGSNVIDSALGSSYVARYNTVTGVSQIFVHSVQSNSSRAGKNWEMYGNSVTSDPHWNDAGIRPRGGTGVIFGNAIAGFHLGAIYLDNSRDYIPPDSPTDCTDSCTIVGYCDGSSDADGNTLENGWPCRDQIGRGKDASAWTSNADAGPAQAAQPMYAWFNTSADSSGAMVYIRPVSVGHIVEDRDFYTGSTTFSATSGVGCGADVPTMNCTPNELSDIGPGYYKLGTGESCSDFTGYTGKSHTKSFSGTLYRCTATNTWSEYYTPSTYPHSLRTEEAAAPAFTSASLNADTLTINLTKDVVVNTNTGFDLSCSGAGDEALTFVSETSGVLTYTIDRSIPQAETCTVAYTTGADYIEDSAGNDLDSFAAQTVQNLTPSEAPTKKLTITKTGSGCIITSSPSGMNCGATCEFDFTTGTSVTLGSYFINEGWKSITYSGGCAGGTADLTNDVADCAVTCTEKRIFK